MVHADVERALEGVTRAMLVTGAFSHDQFEQEAHFIEVAARKGLEVTVRVSTHSGLIKPGTKGAYGRAHHGIASFIEAGKYRVVDLCPDWFLTNWLLGSAEVKGTGKLSLPVQGTGPKITMLDPADVGLAAAAILKLPVAGLAPLLAKRTLEVKGASRVNFADVAAALGKATGQPFALQPIPAEAFVGVLTGFGIPRVFAYSFLETYQQMDGVVPAGYEGYGEALFHWAQESSPELLALGWRAKTVEEWCNSPAIKAAFSK